MLYHSANTNTELAASPKKILDVNQTHFMITARSRLASRYLIGLNLTAMICCEQHEIQLREGGREGRGSQYNYNSVLCTQPGYIVYSNYLHMAPGHQGTVTVLPTFTRIPRDIYRKVLCGALAGLARSDPNLQMRVPVSK